MAETAVTSALGWDNFFSTTTTGALTATTTTIPLATPPTPTEGFLVLDPGGANEIIFYNSVSGNNVIVPTTDDRGRGDSTAQAHSSGITVKMNTVGMMFEALQSGRALSANSVVTANITNSAVTPAKRSGGFYVGSIAPTGNGQASVTGVGFQPKFIEMHLIPGTSSSVAKMCHGFSDGTTTFSAGFQAVESGDTSRVQSTALICFNPSTNGAVVDEITLDSFDADGFTYTKADHNGTETFRYICFG